MSHFSNGSVAYANNSQISIKMKNNIENNLGLNESFLKQYIKWFNKIIKGDLGTSLISGEKIQDIIIKPLINTIILVFSSLIILFLFSLICAILSIYYKDSLFDKILSFMAFLLFCIPGFALGLCILAIFSYKTNIIFDELFLPILCIVLSNFALFLKFNKNALNNTLKQNFIQASFARGLSKKRIYFHIVLLHSLSSIINYISTSSASFVSSTYIIEAIFSYNGIGALSIKSIIYKDYFVLLPIIFFFILSIFFINLTSELINKIINKKQNYV